MVRTSPPGAIFFFILSDFRGNMQENRAGSPAPFRPERGVPPRPLDRLPGDMYNSIRCISSDMHRAASEGGQGNGPSGGDGPVAGRLSTITPASLNLTQRDKKSAYLRTGSHGRITSRNSAWETGRKGMTSIAVKAHRGDRTDSARYLFLLFLAGCVTGWL